MKWLVFISALALTACSKPADVVVVSLTPQPGPGRIPTAMGDMGPSSDPVGKLDLSEEETRGIPDTLGDLYVRYIDFQWSHQLLQAYRAGRIDSTQYSMMRDPTRQVTIPDAPFDQHVQYAVGRRSNGDFEVVFDTDNDEDLSDEEALILPWDGPPLDRNDYLARFTSALEGIRVLGSLPRTSVSVQLTDGVNVFDTEVLLAIAPHLRAVYPTGPAGETVEFPSYIIGAYQNMVGVTKIGGTDYTFWVGSNRLGVYPLRDTQIWFESGDRRSTPVDSTKPFVSNPYLIGQVVELGGQFYRLDDIRVDGAELRLVAVDNMPGVGIRGGMHAPEFASVTIDGDAIKLSDFRGKFVLLDFWSTTCGPCVADMPDTKRLYDQFSREDFEIVGIAEDAPEWLRQFVTDNGITWAQVTQDRHDETARDILDEYKVTGIPAYFLIDPAGKIVDPSVGVRPVMLADTLDYLIANWK